MPGSPSDGASLAYCRSTEAANLRSKDSAGGAVRANAIAPPKKIVNFARAFFREPLITRMSRIVPLAEACGTRSWRTQHANRSKRDVLGAQFFDQIGRLLKRHVTIVVAIHDEHGGAPTREANKF